LAAPIGNSVNARSVSSYNAVIDQFGVDRNPRYAPHDGLTFCNIFVSDVTRAMEAPIPHRVDAVYIGNPKSCRATTTQRRLPFHRNPRADKKGRGLSTPPLGCVQA